MHVLLVSTDLMFASRIRGAAQRRNLDFATASAGKVDSLAPGQDLRLVLIDLFHVPAEQLPGVVQRFGKLEPPPRIVAYGPHVDEANLSAARQAGCDTVLTRGQFDQQINQLLDG